MCQVAWKSWAHFFTFITLLKTNKQTNKKSSTSPPLKLAFPKPIMEVWKSLNFCTCWWNRLVLPLKWNLHTVLIIYPVALTSEPVDEILWQMKLLQQHSPPPPPTAPFSFIERKWGKAGYGHSVFNTHLWLKKLRQTPNIICTTPNTTDIFILKELVNVSLFVAICQICETILVSLLKKKEYINNNNIIY